MLSFIYSRSGKLLSVTSEFTRDGISRWDFKTMADAEKAAADATALTGDRYIATDAGPSTSPRYDVIAAPKVGDAVSMIFNGDYYPVGTIASISPTLKKITTSDGKDFFRVRKTGAWRNAGTWSLTAGTIDKRNPSF